MTPIIAIPKLGPGLTRLYFRYLFESALTAAGARIRWIGPENIGAVTQCDGLLLPGGDDVDPTLYGQKKSEKCGKQNPLRDRLDPALLKAFLPTGKPILGICRGMQMLNVHLGGTLHQDIKELQQICHQNSIYRAKPSHTVTLAQNAKLQTILGADRITVNSIHHQALDSLGQGLFTAARSEDGIAEAVELEGHPFCIGLQWHPEILSRQCPGNRAILAAFVKACQ